MAEPVSILDRPGLPWEREVPGYSPAGGFQTLRAILLAPGAAFESMHQTGGLGAPILFLVIFGTLGTFFALLWQSATRTLWGAGFGGDVSSIVLSNTFSVLMLLLSPLLVLLWSAVMAAIYHLLLLLLGGAPQPFETTYRVVCYATGATYLWLLVPMCGGFVAAIWNLVATIIGLTRAQEVPGGRAAAAVLLPLVLVCFCCAAIVGIGMFGAFATMGLVE